MAEKSYKFRIYPTEEQERQIQKTFGCCRYVYNYYLAKRKELWESEKKTMTFYDCCKDLTVLKRQEEYNFLKEIDIYALRSALKNLDDAYKNFFRGIKTGQKVGYPRYKSKKDKIRCYGTKNVAAKNSLRVDGRHIVIPKLGKVKCRGYDNGIEGRILGAHIEQNACGEYYCSICCTDVKFNQYEKNGESCGIDLGLKTLATLDDGTIYQNPKFLSKSEKRLKKLSRSLSRKKKGSKRWEKDRLRVAKLQEHIANQRRDNMQKATTDIIKRYDVICMEDLNVEGMAKNHKIAKSISDASLSEFRKEIEYKAEWHGRKVSIIDMWYPSSQTCSVCGWKWDGIKNLAIRRWKCQNCGTYHDRDVNAAKNIKTEGLRILHN